MVLHNMVSAGLGSSIPLWGAGICALGWLVCQVTGIGGGSNE